ncbi:sigma factor G inhibitor Gin [Scopulibacillus cellulosilyticus]|uniref:Sigma factor G inhibitor Gin n=1 Tax=Scopulibacillus cellulosilyticus TaxID=2665665 RepID=A0ABW2Q165_9BACL
MAILTNKHAGETCIICEKQKRSGIHICDQLICDSCQKHIIETDVSDIKYQYILKKLSKLSITLKDTVKSRHS